MNNPEPSKKVKAIRDIELEPSATEGTRQVLAAAAASTSFDLHYAAGFEATYQAIEGYLQRHPAPEPTPLIEAAFSAAELAVPFVPAEMAMLNVWGGLVSQTPCPPSRASSTAANTSKAADGKH